MEKLINKLEELTGEISEYTDTRIGLAKLSAAEKSSKLAGTMVAKALVAILFLTALLFASFALAYALSGLTGKLYLGFLIVSALYILTGLLLWKSIRKYVSRAVTNNLLREIFKEEKEE